MKVLQDDCDYFNGVKAPNMILINYDWDHKKWIVTENYSYPKTDKKMKGKFKESVRKEFTKLDEYVIRKEFVWGTVLIDAMEFPGGNIHSFNIGHFRTEHGLMGKDFSINFISDEDRSNEDDLPGSLIELNILEDGKEIKK